MRHFVLQLMRGLLFCLVAISVTACSDLVQELQGEQSGMYPALQSKVKITELARIDKIRMRVAQNALSNEDYDTAIRFFNSVHESAPVNPLPLIGLGEANLALGKLHEAETAYRSAVRVDPRSARALEGLGTVLVSRSAFEDAIDHFNRSLAQVPSASLHNKLGVAHDLKGDGIGAQRHYRAALVLDPNIVSARNNLALSLVVSQAYDEAIGEMEQVAAHPDSTARHKQNLAFVYGMAGRFDSASATLRENGVSQDEITQNRSIYSRMRDMAKKGNRTELLAFLRNAEPGDNLPEVDLSQPAAVSSDLASASPDAPPEVPMTNGSAASSMSQDTLRKEDKVLPPNAMENISKLPDNISEKPGDMSPAPGKKMPEPLPETLPEPITKPVTKPVTEPAPETAPETKMAKLSDAAQPIAVKTPVSLPDVDLATGPYRIQLASYRTSKNTARGQNVL
ncbi:MAG: tetratricopeptide repeat protein, partial [Rhodospirillaceae bacterium]|nr:tetratricopeptide repeat protein [Rhodospirillaceae bacterium]